MACEKKKKRRRRGEILRTGRAPLEKASASGFTSVLDIHAHFLRGSCHFFSPSSREGNLIFLRQPTCAPTSVQQQPAQTPTRMPVPVYRPFDISICGRRESGETGSTKVEGLRVDR